MRASSNFTDINWICIIFNHEKKEFYILWISKQKSIIEISIWTLAQYSVLIFSFFYTSTYVAMNCAVDYKIISYTYMLFQYIYIYVIMKKSKKKTIDSFLQINRAADVAITFILINHDNFC